jgi:hypothetical protein
VTFFEAGCAAMVLIAVAIFVGTLRLRPPRR